MKKTFLAIALAATMLVPMTFAQAPQGETQKSTAKKNSGKKNKKGTKKGTASSAAVSKKPAPATTTASAKPVKK